MAHFILCFTSESRLSHNIVHSFCRYFNWHCSQARHCSICDFCLPLFGCGLVITWSRSCSFVAALVTFIVTLPLEILMNSNMKFESYCEKHFAISLHTFFDIHVQIHKRILVSTSPIEFLALPLTFCFVGYQRHSISPNCHKSYISSENSLINSTVSYYVTLKLFF